MGELNRVKVITSHVGLARFLSEVSEEPIGEIPRREDIPSPYSYSPSWPVWQWGERRIIWSETRHKRYEVFDVSGLPVLPLGTL